MSVVRAQAETMSASEVADSEQSTMKAVKMKNLAAVFWKPAGAQVSWRGRVKAVERRRAMGCAWGRARGQQRQRQKSAGAGAHRRASRR